MNKGIIVFVIIVFQCFSVFSTSQFDLNPVSVITGTDAMPFERAEALIDRSSEFKKEQYHENADVSHTKLLKLLKGNNTPDSNTFILHYAPGWNTPSQHDPVLLVHGAGDTAYRAWVHPLQVEVEDESQITYAGLMQHLSKKGFQVFAVTFPHCHGDNFYQAEHIANAITRIRHMLNRDQDPDFKVDIVTHSKGGAAANIYLSSLKEQYRQYFWMTAFRNDVDMYVAVACPFKGVDTMFRYYGYNLMVMQNNNPPAPLAPSTMLFYGMPVDLRDYNNSFPGQLQILHNFASDSETRIPLSMLSLTPFDMNLTMTALYYGGASGILTSGGIDKAVKEGGNVIEMFNAKGLDSSVRLCVLAGKNQVINETEMFGFKIPIYGETADESDGLLFVKSATYTKGALRRGAQLVDKAVLDFNHITINCSTPAREFITDSLKK